MSFVINQSVASELKVDVIKHVMSKVKLSSSLKVFQNFIQIEGFNSCFMNFNDVQITVNLASIVFEYKSEEFNLCLILNMKDNGLNINDFYYIKTIAVKRGYYLEENF